MLLLIIFWRSFFYIRNLDVSNGQFFAGTKKLTKWGFKKAKWGLEIMSYDSMRCNIYVPTEHTAG